MESAGEVLRQRFCRASGCGALFWICRRCDRGQQYCSERCRLKARREQRRAANVRHQRSLEGKLDHRDRQRAYRQRLARARVTDQASQDPYARAKISAPLFTPPVTTREHKNRLSLSDGLPYCMICGRPGRFVNPFDVRKT
jgi:hypothetical protein